MGPSNRIQLAMVPIPPLILKSLLFPSFWNTSSTEETRPPCREGIPPL